MKLQVTQENLRKALSTVSRVADARGTLPILANILLKTDQNRLQISATNLEIAITKRIGGKVVNPGDITVPARLMSDFVASLPAGNIELEVEGNKLHITSGTYNSTINGITSEEFPAIPTVEKPEPIIISNEDMKTSLNQSVFAASNDEARPVLTATLFTSINKKLAIVATDSYRLAEKTTGAEAELTSPLLVPASAAQDLVRILGDSTSDVEMFVDESQAMFRVGETELVTRLIDGSFPQYEQLLPSESETSFKVDRAELISIVKVASLFARESAGSITLNVSEGDQNISVKSVASQVGENTSTAKAKVEGDGQVTLNSRFLLEALNAFNSEEITFGFSGKLSPCLLAAEDDDSYRHVVMPLKA